MAMAVVALGLSILAVLFAGVARPLRRSGARLARTAPRAARLRRSTSTGRAIMASGRRAFGCCTSPAGGGERDGLWIVNEGPGRYQARVALIPREGGGPVEALHVATANGGTAVVREGEEAELGRQLAVGDKHLLRLTRDRSLRRGIVRLRFTCSNEHGDEWVTAAECEIPGRVPRVHVRHSDGDMERA